MRNTIEYLVVTNTKMGSIEVMDQMTSKSPQAKKVMQSTTLSSTLESRMSTSVLFGSVEGSHSTERYDYNALTKLDTFIGFA